MSDYSRNSIVPSGFFSPNAQQQANRSHRARGSGQQRHNVAQQHLNYGQPSTGFYAHGAASQSQSYAGNASATSYHSSHPGSTTTPTNEYPRKRLRREDAVFRCEPCDLDLDSQVALQSHKKSHVKCSSCDFEGAPKVVKGHFQSAHGKFSGSGFKTVTVAVPGCPMQRFRICVGNRPEDVQKWIEERKKRFPRSRPLPLAPAPEETKKVEPISALMHGYSSSEEEEMENDNHSQSTPRPEQSTPLDQKPSVSNETQEQQQPQKKPCHSFVRHGHCRRGDACPYRHDENLRKPAAIGNKRKEGSKKNKRDLLANLLESDGDREAKLSLQLIHYMVHSDFLKKRI